MPIQKTVVYLGKTKTMYIDQREDKKDKKEEKVVYSHALNPKTGKFEPFDGFDDINSDSATIVQLSDNTFAVTYEHEKKILKTSFAVFKGRIE